jgi:hypothetical protein
MVGRALLVWLLLLVVVVLLGALRTALLEPRVGEPAAHVVGTLVVVGVFLTVIWFAAPWLSPGLQTGALLKVGILWVLLTVSFEFVFGHYVMGNPWSKLLADYNLLAGRLWVLVLLTLLVGPLAVGWARAGSTPA